MATASDVIRIAEAEVGYKEGDSNYNKYGIAYGVNSVEWCVQFVWWVFREANASNLFGSKTARCTILYQNHITQEVPRSDLKRGDVVFFDWSGKQEETDHVGFVYENNGSSIVTIEGNTGGTGGEGVHKKTRDMKWVSHNYRPAYTEPMTAELITIQLPVLKKGSLGYEVKTMQRLLMSYGYSMSPYGADGDFGNLTEKRVKEFQKKRGIVQDGIVGLGTWTALLKG